MQKVQRSGATIYCMNYSKLLTPFTMKSEEYRPSGSYLQGVVELTRLAKGNTMNTLAALSGGKRFGFQTEAGLERDLMLLSKDLHSRYLVSFTPAVEPASTFHKIDIAIQNRPGTVTHARPGYWSLTP